MQALDAEKNTQRCRDGELISSFRPSQSFIHIKYLKSKIEEANSAAKSGSDVAESDTSPGPEELEKVKSAKAIQPPLPPNSPPPDIPLVVNIKQEVPEESNGNLEEMTESNQSMDSVKEQKVFAVDQSSDKPKKTMCRNFVRGTCTRGSACIFSHKLDISQLKGVYTFCKNFQNRVCTLPTCKFVHATVFEKENFFRTGYLPPHTLSHLKQPPLPPPPPPEEPPPPSPPSFFSNPPPVNINTGVQPALTPVPILKCQHSGNMKPTPKPYAPATITSSFLSTPTTHTTTSQTASSTLAIMPTNKALKRDWSELASFSSPPQDFDVGEPVIKKCKHCDYNEFRLRYNKAKVKVMKSSLEKFNKKMATLDKKNNKIYTCLVTLFKDGNHPTHPIPTPPSMALDLDDDKNLLGGLLETLLFGGTMQPDTS